MKRNLCILLFIVLGLFTWSGCATLPTDFERQASHVLKDTDNTRLGKGFQKLKPDNPDLSGFHLLGNGLDAFVARAVLAKAAEKSIDTQYYMIHNDVVGSLFIYQLYQAAERGVRIRLLLDDIDQGGKDFGAAVFDSHPNFEVRIFNPFSRNTGRTKQFVTGFGEQTRRAHNKSYTVDNQATILGGRNIGDEYFEADPEMAFVDLDVLAVGPVARDVSASFDLYWNSELSYPIAVLVDTLPTPQEVDEQLQVFNGFVEQQAHTDYVKSLIDSDLANRIRQGTVSYQWAPSQVLADDPQKLLHDTDETQYHLSTQLKPHLEEIQEELVIYSPYFVPGKKGVAFFKSLREKNVRVKILTNALSSTDVSVVHAGYSKYRKDLLRMGVELFELNTRLTKEERHDQKQSNAERFKFSLHAKSFIFDRKKVFIGSFNLDAQSRIQNTEIGVIFNSQTIASYMAEQFDLKIDKAAFRLELKTRSNGSEKIQWHGLVDGEPTVLDVDPYTGFWKRFGIGCMRILPMESLL